MKIKEIRVGKSMKVSIGYNSVSSSMSITVDIEDNDNIDEIKQNLSVMIDEFLKQDIVNQIANLNHI